MADPGANACGYEENKKARGTERPRRALLSLQLAAQIQGSIQASIQVGALHLSEHCVPRARRANDAKSHRRSTNTSRGPYPGRIRWLPSGNVPRSERPGGL